MVTKIVQSSHTSRVTVLKITASINKNTCKGREDLLKQGNSRESHTMALSNALNSSNGELYFLYLIKV